MRRLLPILVFGVLITNCKSKPPAQPTPTNQVTPAPCTGPDCPKENTPPTKTPPPKAPDQKTPLRLGDKISPVRYQADLTLDPALPTFTGVIEINIKISEGDNTIILNATDIDIDDVALRVGSNQLTGTSARLDREGVALLFSERFSPGEATLVLGYHGKVSDNETSGIFRQKEGDKWYIMTQFEATDARRAFPCFDEPGFKTPWRITMHIPKELSAVSNTAIEEEREELRTKKIKFAQTKPLPSYLIAFGVGDYDIIDGGKAGKNNTAIRIVAPKGRGPEAKYPAEISGKILSLSEDYFDSPYPFEKLDLLVIPETVGFGAMENPGLITFASRAILAKPEEQTVRYQRRYASVAAHEIAHMWFGDLVTPVFWDDVWLNESFASWMTDKVLSAWKPEWPVESWAANSRVGVMGSDSLSTARKIRQPIKSNDDISNAFDGITYSKGKAVLQMFEGWLGADTFRKIIQTYLTSRAYQNATAQDFIAAIEKVSGADAGAAFSSFIEQDGMPMVSASLSCAKGAPTISLKQERFLPLGSTGDKNRSWKIPVCVRYPAGKAVQEECTLLQGETGEFALANTKKCPDWFLPNAKGTGYYHVRYETALLQKLLDNSKSLSISERLVLLGDARALASRGDIPTGDVLALLPKFLKDPSPFFYSGAASFMGGIRTWLVPADSVGDYQKALQKMFGAKQKSLGFTPSAKDDDETRLLRPTLLVLLGDNGENKQIREEATIKAKQWLTDRKGIDPELVSEVLLLAARSGDKALFDAFVKEAKGSKERRDRRMIFSALGSFDDPGLAKEGLALMLSADFDIRESISILWATIDNPKNSLLGYEFATTNFEALAAKVPNNSVAGLIRVGGVFCNDAKSSEVENFFQKYSTQYTGGPRILAQTVEGIRLCGAAQTAQTPSVVSFLKKY